MDRDMSVPEIESHPLAPFMPDGARVLIMGTFPPKKIALEHGFLLPQQDK